MNKLYIITGGPGVGKTTLLNALAADGITTGISYLSVVQY